MPKDKNPAKHPKIRMREVGWNQIEQLCEELAGKIRESGFKPHVIVGIARGGWIPARLLSDRLLIANLASMRTEFYEDVGKTKKEPEITQCVSADVKGKSVLLVDDVSDTGLSLLTAKKHLEGAGAREIKIATLHYKPLSKVKPDFYAQETTDWLVYAWEKNETYSKRLKQGETAATASC